MIQPFAADFLTAAEAVKELIAAIGGQSDQPFKYQARCAVYVLGFAAETFLPDRGQPMVGSKLTVFLRWVLPIIKAWLEKMLPNLFGISAEADAKASWLSPSEQAAKVQEWWDMPNE